MAAARTHAINARVVDPFGDPLTGVSLEAIAQDGGRAPQHPRGYTTDDLGRGRVFDLRPGRYTLCAQIDYRDIASRTGADRLLRTCYPATDDAHAEPIRVGTSDVDGIEIEMRRARTYAIAGVVSTPPGISRADAMIAIYRPRNHSPVLEDIPVDADGRFRLLNVEPGHYVIAAFVADDTLLTESRAAAFAEVRVENADVDGVVIALAKTVAVNGRVIPEEPGGTLPPRDANFDIEARLAGEHVPGSGSVQRARFAGPDWTFTITGVFGRRVFDMNAPSGWYVKSLRYGGTEIIDAATELAGGREAPSLDVILSRRGAVVTGTVVEDGGKPAPAIVCLLRTRAADGSVVVAARGTTARDGTFSVGPVRGGDYALVALPASSEMEILSFTQDRLTRLAALGDRVTLSDVDERRVQLRLMRER